MRCTTKPNDSASGLTIREYFAVQILQGIFAEQSSQSVDDIVLVRDSVKVADFLIEELNRGDDK